MAGQGNGARRAFAGPMAAGLAAALAFGLPGAQAADSCAALKDLKLPHATVTGAESVPAGAFAAPDKKTYAGLPAFCRVTATLEPLPDSAIRVEMWLPEQGWSGVFEGTGNGGYGGAIVYGSLASGLKRGYAVVNTDQGAAPSTVLNGDPLIGRPVKWRDWGFRATHEMTVAGKTIAAAYYGRPSRPALFAGCSTGGQQALIEAQLYPEDYDGIVAGAPVIDRTHLHAAFVWNFQSAQRSPGALIGAEKLGLLASAAAAACGPGPGGLNSEPFVSDPAKCAFDPATLVCKGDDKPDCLTAEQAETAARFYAGPKNPLTGASVYPGWPRGSERAPFGWALLQGAPPRSLHEPAFDSLFKWTFGPDWDWRGFTFGGDLAETDAVLGGAVNGATAANIDAFAARGGKLLIYHGWADAIVNPFQTVAFADALAKAAGGAEALAAHARLFLLPGVEHCGVGGGDGPNAIGGTQGLPAPVVDTEHDVIAALAHWVETGAAPDRLIATKYEGDDPTKRIVMQRPACPWPKAARYAGTGSPNEAASFVCQ